MISSPRSCWLWCHAFSVSEDLKKKKKRIAERDSRKLPNQEISHSRVIPSGGLARIIQACTSDMVSLTLLRFLSHYCTLVLVIKPPRSTSSEIAHSGFAWAVVKRLNWSFDKSSHNKERHGSLYGGHWESNANKEGPAQSKCQRDFKAMKWSNASLIFNTVQMLEFTRNIVACELQLLNRKTANYGLFTFYCWKKKNLSFLKSCFNVWCIQEPPHLQVAWC